MVDITNVKRVKYFYYYLNTNIVELLKKMNLCLFYNIFNLVIWSFLMGTYLQIGIVPKSYLMIVQSFALIEPLLIIFKFIKSALLITLIQVASRLLFAWYFFLYPGSEIGYLLMTLCWIITEIIRSFYYLHQNRISTYLRYSAFIVLYPLGALGEILYMLKVMKLLNPRSKLFLTLVMLMYIPLFPFLYLHMLKQRKKKLL